MLKRQSLYDPQEPAASLPSPVRASGRAGGGPSHGIRPSHMNNPLQGQATCILHGRRTGDRSTLTGTGAPVSLQHPPPESPWGSIQEEAGLAPAVAGSIVPASLPEVPAAATRPRRAQLPADGAAMDPQVPRQNRGLLRVPYVSSTLSGESPSRRRPACWGSHEGGIDP